MTKSDENLSSKKEMEGKQKNLVEDPQVMSQAVDLQKPVDSFTLANFSREFLFYNHMVKLLENAKDLEEFQGWITRERDVLAQRISPEIDKISSDDVSLISVDSVSYSDDFQKAADVFVKSTDIQLVELKLIVPLDIYNFFDSIIKLCKWDFPSATALFQENLLSTIEADLDCHFSTMPGFNKLKQTIELKIKTTLEILKGKYKAAANKPGEESN